MLLSVSEDGELAFWIPENVLFVSTANGDARVTNGVAKAETVWKCTGKVRTGKKGITMASCSSAKKSCLGRQSFPSREWAVDHVLLLTPLVFTVVSTPDGDELTIWDSKESEFSLGLEFRQVFR